MLVVAVAVAVAVVVAVAVFSLTIAVAVFELFEFCVKSAHLFCKFRKRNSDSRLTTEVLDTLSRFDKESGNSTSKPSLSRTPSIVFFVTIGISSGLFVGDHTFGLGPSNLLNKRYTKFLEKRILSDIGSLSKVNNCIVLNAG